MAPSDTPTTRAIYATYERDPQRHRPHLGASRIGIPCERALWYEFRWCASPTFDGRMLRLFESGHQGESRLLKNMRAAGIDARSMDPTTGKQYSFHDPSCTFFSGSLDAIAKGFPDDPDTEYVVEIKTSSKKQFDTLEIIGVARHKPEHYAQMQMYMHWSGIHQARYLVVCKDDERIYEEIVTYSQDDAETLTERAHRIITADEPPAKKNTNPDRPPCLWCEFRGICYGTQCPEVNCRTCAHSTFRYDKMVCVRDSRVGVVSPIDSCGMKNHIFIPHLVPLEIVGADPDNGTITYITDTCEEITNGPGHVSSEKLREMVNK